MNAAQIASVAVIGAVVLVTPTALGQSSASVLYYKVFISTDSGQSGWNGDFARMSAPAINESGDIAFEGDTNIANGRGVWFGDFNGFAYTVSKIAQEGDTFTHSFPGFSGPVQVQYTLDTPQSPSTPQGAVGFSLPVIDNAGRVAFIGSIVSPDATQGEAVLFRTDASQAPAAIAGAPFRKTPTTSDGGSQFHHRWFSVANTDYRLKSHLALPRGGDGTLAWYSNLDTIDPADDSDTPPFLLQQGAVEREGGVFFGMSTDDHQEIVRY